MASLHTLPRKHLNRLYSVLTMPRLLACTLPNRYSSKYDNIDY